MEFAQGNELPVLYFGFSHREQNSIPLQFTTSDLVYFTVGVKFRYVVQLDSFAHIMKWQRALAPWMNKLKRSTM